MPGLARPLTSLLYADDVVLLANSRDSLQQLLDGVQRFSEDWGMCVNASKTQAMLVGGSAGQRAAFYGAAAQRVRIGPRCGPRALLQHVRTYKYLGITVDSTRGFSGALSQRAAAGERALHAMYGRCARAGLWGSLDLRLRLFDTLVAPVLDYGAAAWAPQAAAATTVGAPPPAEALDAQAGPPDAQAPAPPQPQPVGPLRPGTTPDGAERLHRQFLRTTLGIPASAPAWPMYEECGRAPLAARWLRDAARLWTSTMAPGAPPQLALHRALMAHNAALCLREGCADC